MVNYGEFQILTAMKSLSMNYSYVCSFHRALQMIMKTNLAFELLENLILFPVWKPQDLQPKLLLRINTGNEQTQT